MDIRYQHPQVASLWSLKWTYGAWLRIEQAIAVAQVENSIIPADEAAAIFQTQPPEGYIEGAMIPEEKKTRHDVAAFVNVLRDWYGEPHARWIHYGVTSSDIVDTAQGMRFKIMYPTLVASLDALTEQVSKWEQDSTIVLGRTHGQAAEPTTMGNRAAHWAELISGAIVELRSTTLCMTMAKVAGPVGTYAHNPREVEHSVAEQLHLQPQHQGASQIVPRGALARWANAAAGVVQACAKIAMDLRLMNLLGEAYEPKQDGQVGSSSMPHKNNPIRAEQITGLARLALGYAVSLQPLDLWLERDISNSSVERIVVPDLWHLTLHVIEQATFLLARTQLDRVGVSHGLSSARDSMHTARLTSQLIRQGASAEKARLVAVEQTMVHPLDARRTMEIPDDLDWYVRNLGGVE